MPIQLLTGNPGAGKTAFMVQRLLEAAAKGERPIFAAGINGLAPGLATVLDDPTRWNEIDPNVEGTCVCGIDFTPDGKPIPRAPHAHTLVPDGSLIFVDEAWKYFGHLHNATHQKTPAHVLALAEHRHRGIDFVWTTQMPNQIYPFVRGMIDEHTHHVRKFGTNLIQTYQWGELNEDVKSQAKRENSLAKLRPLPKESFDKYKSSSTHTIKAKLPWRLLMLPLVALAAIAAVIVSVNLLRPESMTAGMEGAGQPGSLLTGGQAASPTATGSERREPKYKSAADYAQQHLPRIGMMPWTAPVYDDRGITADPQLICMSSPGGPDAQGEYKEPSCTCLTEQGTAYDLSQPECRTLARRGPVYNPYKERSREGHQPAQLQQAQQQATQQRGPASVVGYQQGARADVFPRNPAQTIGGYTGPTATL